VLRDRNLLDSVGGAAFVTELFVFVPSAANVGYYLDIVRDKAMRRDAIRKAEQTIVKARDEACKFPVVGSYTAIEAVSLMRLADTMPEEQKTLLGDRFLCVGGG